MWGQPLFGKASSGSNNIPSPIASSRQTTTRQAVAPTLRLQKLQELQKKIDDSKRPNKWGLFGFGGKRKKSNKRKSNKRG